MKTWEIRDAQVRITQAGLDNSAAKLIPPDSVLVVVRSGVLKHTVPIALNRVPVAINQDMKALQCCEGVHPDFLAHFLKASSPEILQWVRATTADNFPIDRLKELRVPLIPLSEQRRIADILDRADALRAKRRAALAQLDTLTQSIFLDMFGDASQNSKQYRTDRLGALCSRITDGTHQPPQWSEAGHPFLFVSNIVSGEISFDTEKFISDETWTELTRRCPIELGDVLYSTVGSYGVPAIVRDPRRFAFQRHIAHLKPNRSLLDPEFLCAMLASTGVRRQADQRARGVAQKTLNLEEIRNYLVLCPSIAEQRSFAHRAAEVRKLRERHRRSLSALDELFVSLQHRAFVGGR
jgi:type I restriction enzyme S subunit